MCVEIYYHLYALPESSSSDAVIMPCLLNSASASSI
jgi:hypothetical protein